MLEKLASQYAGRPVNSHLLNTGSASSRIYYRFDVPGIVGAVGKVKEENRAFVYLSGILQSHGVNVPSVKTVSDDGLSYLVEDLGDTSLYDIVREKGWGDETIDLMTKTIGQIARFHSQAIAGCVDRAILYPVGEMDQRSIQWDLDYFKYCFLKVAGVEIDEVALWQEMSRMNDTICCLPHRVLIHRDFQSRNVMIKDGEPYLIDYQGARIAPAIYDIVSFLWQVRLECPDEVKQRLLEEYMTVSGHHYSDKQICTAVLFRMLQVLGAYGFRGIIQNKDNFKSQIPRALMCAASVLKELDYPYLQSVIETLATNLVEDSLVEDSNENKALTGLTVTISSFSFKKGYPVDTTGNGGGFVFDCRALPNPGRYDEFKCYTGRDICVERFLDKAVEMQRFLQSSFSLIDQSVNDYIKRGFSNLAVNFGCTGGQHRSVYSACKTAEHLSRCFPGVNVVLRHREQPDVKGLVLAAGLGTRLGNITAECPKALVEVGGHPLLYYALTNIAKADVNDTVVNVHHHAGLVERWIHDTKLPTSVSISDEREKLLDTGGALRHAQSLLGDCKNVIIANADIFTDVSLSYMSRVHVKTGCDATLLVSRRQSSRQLGFDSDGKLIAWKNLKTGDVKSPYKTKDNVKDWFSFNGIHIVGRNVLDRIADYADDGDVFSIIDFYLQNSGVLDIRYYIPTAPYTWYDVGTPQKLKDVQEFLSVRQ